MAAMMASRFGVFVDLDMMGLSVIVMCWLREGLKSVLTRILREVNEGAMRELNV